MGTKTWHLLGYSADLIKHVGGIQFPHGHLLEVSHKLLKTVYGKSSKRQDLAMDEIVRRYNEKLQNEYLSGRISEQRVHHN